MDGFDVEEVSCVDVSWAFGLLAQLAVRHCCARV